MGGPPHQEGQGAHATMAHMGENIALPPTPHWRTWAAQDPPAHATMAHMGQNRTLPPTPQWRTWAAQDPNPYPTHQGPTTGRGVDARRLRTQQRAQPNIQDTKLLRGLARPAHGGAAAAGPRARPSHAARIQYLPRDKGRTPRDRGGPDAYEIQGSLAAFIPR